MPDISMDYTLLSRNAAELCAFVVVAKHGQLSSAARELKISQPGLSQRIKNLEDMLGRKLFDRTHRGVRLNAEGTELFERVEPLLGPLAAGFHEFANRAKTPSVLVSVDFAFASFWLLPRLPRLREAIHPIDISLLTSQQPEKIGNLNADIVIRIGDPETGDKRQVKLMGESVSAVCSPGFLARHGQIGSVKDLLDAPLLSLSGPTSSSWYDWDSWLASFGINARSVREKTSFNTYDIVVRAAQDGLGVALGWHGLIDDFLASGDLVRAVPDVASGPRGYFIHISQKIPTVAAKRVYEWVLSETATDRTARN